MLVDHEPTVLVVEDGIRGDRLDERVDPRAAVAAKHVRQRDLGVLGRDARRVEPDRRAAVLGHDPAPRLDLVEDRLRHGIARPERVRELLAVGIEQHGAVRARRLWNGVALHRGRPRTAVRVVLQRVEVACLRAGVHRDPRDLAGRVRMVRRELAARLGLGEAAPARRQHEGRRLDVGWSVLRVEGRDPAGLRRRDRAKRVVGQLGFVARLVPLAQCLGDRVSRPIADLEQALPGRASAAREAVAAVLSRELDAELLEPVDRRARVAGEHLDELRVGGVVRGAHDVLGVDLRRVVVAERRLDTALRLRRVARLQRRLRGEPDACARVPRGHGSSEPGRTGPDDEHVEGSAVAHGSHRSAPAYSCH